MDGVVRVDPPLDIWSGATALVAVCNIRDWGLELVGAGVSDEVDGFGVVVIVCSIDCCLLGLGVDGVVRGDRVLDIGACATAPVVVGACAGDGGVAVGAIDAEDPACGIGGWGLELVGAGVSDEVDRFGAVVGVGVLGAAGLVAICDASKKLAFLWVLKYPIFCRASKLLIITGPPNKRLSMFHQLPWSSLRNNIQCADSCLTGSASYWMTNDVNLPSLTR